MRLALIVLIIPLSASVNAQDGASLSPQERMIGEQFEIGVARDPDGRRYMLDFSDPLFLTRTSKLRKIWGAPSVLTGDTLRIQNETIRLSGIRAPDISQTCTRKDFDLQFDAGGFALGALKTWARSDKAVVCYVTDSKPLQGTCFIWGMVGPMNIARLLVREGAAWADPPDTSPYVRDEGWAEGVASQNRDAAIKNLWHTDCKPPWKQERATKK